MREQSFSGSPFKKLINNTMADVADAAPFPENPSYQPHQFIKVQAILGRENYANGLHYTTVEVRKRPGNIIQEPLDETREGSQSLAEDRNKYFSERERLKTFEKWTDSYPVLPQDLAKNGFIHIGPQDRVMCVFCLKVIYEWQPGNNVQEEHKRLYPDCPFVTGSCGSINKPILVQRNRNLNAHLNALNPRVPALVDETTRLDTFEFWPSSNNQNPKILAEAGFFYKPQPGKPDRVRCFMCGKYLHRWEPHDDVWIEHGRISPNCKFVLHVRGQEFVNKCLAPKEAPTPEPMESTPSPSLSVPSGSALAEEVPSNHTAVQAVLQEFGSDYTEEQVLKAFQKLSLEKGKEREITAGELLGKLL